MNTYERANQLAVSFAGVNTFAVYAEYTATGAPPTRTSVDGVSTLVLDERSPTCAVSIIPKRFTTERWCAVEFPIVDAATEYTITINSTAYTVNPSGVDLRAGLLNNFIEAWVAAPITDITMEINNDMSLGRIVLYGSGITTVTCGAATGTGTVLGKCDAASTTVEVWALVNDLFWCRTPIGPRVLTTVPYTDIYSIGPYTQLRAALTAATKDAVMFGTGFTACVAVLYSFGVSGVE